MIDLSQLIDENMSAQDWVDIIEVAKRFAKRGNIAYMRLLVDLKIKGDIKALKKNESTQNISGVQLSIQFADFSKDEQYGTG